MTFLLYLLSSLVAHAQVGSTADALGGAGVANDHPTEASFLNPAGLAFYKDAHLAAGYRTGKGPLGDARQYHAVIADASAENLFSGSIAYRQRDYDSVPGGDIVEKEFIATAAYRLPQLALGLRGYKKQTDLIGDKRDQYNGDAGIQWLPSSRVSLAVLQTGMFSTKDYGYPLGVLPATTLGVMYSIPEFVAVVADFSYAYDQNPQDRWSHSVGISLQHIEFLRINIGGRIDDRAGEAAYTAGLQFWGPRLKVGYAYQKEVRRELGEMHTIDISMNL